MRENFGSRVRVAETTLGLVSVAIGLIMWWAAAHWVFPPILFASPVVTFSAFVETLLSGELIGHVTASGVRILAGFSIGCAITLPLGLAMGQLPMVRAILAPHLNFFRFIPPIALISLAILWFGIGEMSKIFLIAYTTSFIVLLNTAAGVAAIPDVKYRSAATLGIGGVNLFRFLIVPATVPHMITGMRIAMGASFMTVVAAEMIAADEGLGYMIFQGRLFYQTGRIFVGLFTLGILGFLADRMFVWIARAMLPHYGVKE